METIDRSWKGFYKISGISQLTGVVLFIAGIVIDSFQNMIPPGTPAAERLVIFGGQYVLFQISNFIYIASDVVFILATLGIYLSLKNIKRNPALIGAALGILGMALDILLRFLFHAAGTIAGNYIAQENESLKAGYIAVTELVLSFGEIGESFALFITGIGYLITGIAMLAGVYSKRLAYLLIVSSLLFTIGGSGFLFSQMISYLFLFSCILVIIISTLIGLRLIAIDREIS